MGALNLLSYGLALVAMRSSGATYVIGMRQLSIAFGVLLGERVNGARRLGVALLVAGCALMGWAA